MCLASFLRLTWHFSLWFLFGACPKQTFFYLQKRAKGAVNVFRHWLHIVQIFGIWPWGAFFFLNWHSSESATLSFAGVDKYTQFSCEAHNKKGVSTSREANINIRGISGPSGRRCTFHCLQIRANGIWWCCAVPPSPVTGVRVAERQSSKLMLSWSPGHDGFSPITKCHIRVRLVPAQTTARRWPAGHHKLSDECKVKEVSRRKGEVTVTRLINVTAPPFQSEVAGLQAVTCYNISVSCSNEVGASPVSTWIQSNTTEGGVWVVLATLGVFS